MPSADEVIALIPIAMRAFSEIFSLIEKLRGQAGLSADQLWALADQQTQQNKADIQAFLDSFAKS